MGHTDTRALSWITGWLGLVHGTEKSLQAETCSGQHGSPAWAFLFKTSGFVQQDRKLKNGGNIITVGEQKRILNVLYFSDPYPLGGGRENKQNSFVS